MIGGTVELLFSGFLGEACSSLTCLILSYGPELFVFKLLNLVSLVNGDQLISGFSSLGHFIIFITWVLYGIVIGLLVGYIKSKRKKISQA